MTRRLMIIVFMLFAFTLALALVLFVPRSRKQEPALSIRIAGVATKNSSGLDEVTWSTAVPKSRSHRAAVLFWSVHFEETNKASVRHFAIALTPTENDLLSTPHLASEEDGILQWGIGQTLNPEKVYRAIGAYHEPNRLEELISWSQRVPIVGRLLPRPTPAFATSAWYEVTTEMEPSGIKGE